MRISSKGQITIPQYIRDQLGLLPNTDITLEINDAGEAIIRKNVHKSNRGKSLINLLTGTASVKMTTDEIMKLTRQ